MEGDKIQISSQNLPKHIAILVDGSEEYSKLNNQELSNVYKTQFLFIKNAIKVALKLNIPLLTFHLKSKQAEEMDSLLEFFQLMLNWGLIKENQIKVSVLGKWYSLPIRLIDPIKNLISETKDYDKFFLNFCINYDGQEEIVDACKLISKQVKDGKIDPLAIDKGLIKENIYTSYFLPPDLIIISGKRKSTNGLLLWDSSQSKIYFSKKLWPDFGKEDFLKGIVYYQKE